eukprot:m.74449 g.74449  ORF g.74449 m.74449 type:complete len:86 (-) comp14432_c1_seq2:228-485(-)
MLPAVPEFDDTDMAPTTTKTSTTKGGPRRKRKRITKAEREAQMREAMTKAVSRQKELKDVIAEARAELSSLRPLVAYILKKEGKA